MKSKPSGAVSRDAKRAKRLDALVAKLKTQDPSTKPFWETYLKASKLAGGIGEDSHTQYEAMVMALAVPEVMVEVKRLKEILATVEADVNLHVMPIGLMGPKKSVAVYGHIRTSFDATNPSLLVPLLAEALVQESEKLMAAAMAICKPKARKARKGVAA